MDDGSNERVDEDEDNADNTSSSILALCNRPWLIDRPNAGLSHRQEIDENDDSDDDDSIASLPIAYSNISCAAPLPSSSSTDEHSDSAAIDHSPSQPPLLACITDGCFALLRIDRAQRFRHGGR